MKYYTKDQLQKKYSGKFIKVYPHHTEYWNEKSNQYETVQENIEYQQKIREYIQIEEDKKKQNNS